MSLDWHVGAVGDEGFKISEYRSDLIWIDLTSER
jgi:hypothetical protein